MKTLLFLSLLLTQFSLQASEPSIQCYYSFTGETLNLLEEMPTNACHVDLIWGQGEVCFTGNIDSIILMMNKGKLNRRSSGLMIEDAQKLNKNKIEFTGIDQRNFWQKRSSLTRCN
jgi:hypothetical protein